MDFMSFSSIRHSGHQFEYNGLRLRKSLFLPRSLKSLSSLIFFATFDMPEEIKNISLIRKDPNFEPNWNRLCWYVNGVTSSASKAFDALINREICARLPVSLKR